LALRPLRLREVKLLNIVGKRYWYFLLSLIIIIPGTISLATNGLKLGTDFTGGTEITFDIPQANATAALDSVVRGVTSNVSFVQPEISRNCPPHCTYLVRTKSITPSQYTAIQKATKKKWPKGSGAVSQSTVSGTIASQLTRQALIAVAAAAIAILLYISFAFRNSPHPFRFGVAAIIAMLHDVLVLLGIFSILGVLLNVEVDAPFVTAVLTIIGFSVHDTIVIFDRIRENIGRRTGDPFETVVNHSILQSFVRSINTSFTVVLTLLAVFLFTGEAIRFFVLAMLIGIISGTYSSIFNASQVLVVWENHEVGRFFSRVLGRGRGAESAKAA
jgi:preprotein translocase subunit SecF